MIETIIGLTGPSGAGKGSVAQHLVQKGFTHYSVRKLLVEELESRGVHSIDRSAMERLGTELRKERGPEYFVSYFITQAAKSGISKIIIDSIRNPLEAKALKDAGGILISIDASPWVRYKRVCSRDQENEISFVVFRLLEDREMVSSDLSDPARIAVHEVMKDADFRVDNSVNLLSCLHDSVDTLLSQCGVPA